MKLRVTPFHPDELKEDPEYRFAIVEDGKQVAYLFTVPVSLLRAHGGQNDYRKVAVNRLNEADFSLDDIASIEGQLLEAFKEILA